MKNFPVKIENREYWISRSIAVVVCLFARNKDNELCVLVTQRGKGTPDPEFVGKYCVPCGYLDYDETCIQAAARELTEETGITMPNTSFKLVSINDNPKEDKRQNITFRYIVKSLSTVEELEQQFTTKNSEKDEVSSIRFVRVSDIDMYEWAFNHDKLIVNIYYSN
jgi:8-oxo-dGTP pyrophosphatase MutT (NUDIX family)